MNRGLVVFLLAVFAVAIAVLARQQIALDDAPREGSPDRPGPPLHAPWVSFEEEREGCGFAVPFGLLWLARRQNDDGSWGTGPAELEGRPLGRAGLTALAALAFTGAGYTPLSRDRIPYEGADYCLGRDLGRADEWLRRDQNEDGTFRSVRDAALEQALATFAFVRLYGMLGHDAGKTRAQSALDALLRMQKADGAWDGSAATAWALIALFEARAAGVPLEAGALDRALRADRYPGHAGASLARILRKDQPAITAWLLLQEGAERDPRNLSWWHLATLSVDVADGPRLVDGRRREGGRTWRQWTELFRTRFLGALEPQQYWRGTTETDAMVRMALGQMTLEVYYQYCAALPDW